MLRSIGKQSGESVESLLKEEKEGKWSGIVTRVWFRSWQCEFFERTKAPLGWTALIVDVCEETTIETTLSNSFNTSYGVTNSRNINKPNNN